MFDRPLTALVDELHRTAGAADTAADGELLVRFVRDRDAAAFELVVWRHGAMVQAVCRRVLGRSAEADDAFQATFLVLLRQARSIRRGDALAGWLHRVAVRVAVRCRRSSGQRLRREQLAARPEARNDPDGDRFDLGPILHAEIDRLPERLRLPFVLCQLEGKTNEEASRLLGVPYGTVLSRLNRARQRLRDRLGRRGVALSAGLGVAAADPVSAALVDAAVRGAVSLSAGAAVAGPAATLAQGVIQAMFVRKLSMLAAGVLAASLVVGVGLTTVPNLTSPTRADEPQKKPADKPNAGLIPKKADEPKPKPPADDPPPKPADKPEPPKPPAEPARAGDPSPLDLLLPAKPLRVFHEDEARVLGTWQVTEVMANGQRRDPQEMYLAVGPFGTMLLQDGEAAKAGKAMTYKLDPDARPAAVDLTAGTRVQSAIYQIDNDVMKLCFSTKDGKRPADFSGLRGTEQVLFTLVRKWPSAETKWADAMFQKGRTHDFGVVKPGDKATHKFVFKNIYDRPIMITGASYSPVIHDGYGAAGPMGPGRPMGPMGAVNVANSPVWIKTIPLPSGWLQPGEEAAIEMTVDPNLVYGSAKMTVTISFQVKSMAIVSRSSGGGMSPRFNRGAPGGMATINQGQTSTPVQSTVDLTITAGRGKSAVSKPK